MYELYTNLKSIKFLSECSYQPTIVDDDQEPYDQPHDAGFDAYTTGYVFLRLCAILKSSFECFGDHPSWSEMQFFVKPFRNRINLMRASVHSLDLEAADQKSVRPRWLVLRCKNKSDTLSHSKVSILRIL